MKIKILSLALLTAYLSASAFPYVNGASTVLYTNVTDPMLMSFAPDGTLYVGRDNRGSGGDAYDLVFISKVGTNASSVVNHGTTLTKDPDAVVYDQLGLVSGTPGSVIVGGTTGTNTSIISKIAPNGVVTTLFGGVLANLGNPRQFIFNSAGRMYVTDSVYGQVLTTTSGAAPTLLCISSNAHGIALDVSNRLAVTSVTEPRIQLFNTNGTLINANFAAVRAESPIVRGPGDAFWGSDLYAVNIANQLIRISPAGAITVMGGGFANQFEMAFGPSNVLYVSELYTDRIYRIAEKIVNVPLPIHWWPGEGNANDIIGGANGFLTVAEGYSSNSTTPKVSFPAGVVGQCFQYDTNGTAFNFGTNTCNAGTNDFTLSFWFNTTTNFQRGLFGKQRWCNYIPGWSVYLLAFTGKLQFFNTGSGPSSSTEHNSDVSVADGLWHHIALVRLQTNCFIYVDGVIQTGPHGGGSTAQSTTGLTDLNNNSQFTMGGANGVIMVSMDTSRSTGAISLGT